MRIPHSSVTGDKKKIEEERSEILNFTFRIWEEEGNKEASILLQPSGQSRGREEFSNLQIIVPESTR